MEKSIEAIWKEAFMQDNTLVVPRINDLYNRKSNDIVDKLRRMFHINVVAIAVAVVAIPVVTGIIELVHTPTAGQARPFVFLPGLALSALLACLVRMARQETARLDAFDKGETSYDYLKTFADWRKSSFERYGRFYQLFYPLFFLIIDGGIWFSMGRFGAVALANEFPHNVLAQNFPDLWILGTIVGTGLMAYFAKPLYRLDVHLVYGDQFNKLDEIIADMEELRA